MIMVTTIVICFKLYLSDVMMILILYGNSSQLCCKKGFSSNRKVRHFCEFERA
jgi:hypothetical protein